MTAGAFKRDVVERFAGPARRIFDNYRSRGHPLAFHGPTQIAFPNEARRPLTVHRRRGSRPQPLLQPGCAAYDSVRATGALVAAAGFVQKPRNSGTAAHENERPKQKRPLTSGRFFKALLPYLVAREGFEPPMGYEPKKTPAYLQWFGARASGVKRQKPTRINHLTRDMFGHFTPIGTISVTTRPRTLDTSPPAVRPLGISDHRAQRPQSLTIRRPHVLAHRII